MKLKCNHNRRALVLPSGTTVHRNDGSKCEGVLTIGEKTVIKMFTRNDNNVVGTKGACVLAVQDDL